MAKIKLIKIFIVGEREPLSLKSSEHFTGEGAFPQQELEDVAAQLRANIARVKVVERHRDAVATTTIQTEHITHFRIIEEVGE